MKKEIRIFLTALMFFTRIPCPSFKDYSDEYLNKATRYFPLIGWVVGVVAAATAFGLNYIFPISISIVFSIAASVLITGAFHEDGFADVCDGFGGGWTQERILDIMKDSRIGAYGAIGLVLLLSLKIVTLIELMNLDVWFCLKAIVLGHVLSRFSSVTFIFTHEYSRADETSKIKPIAKKLALKDFLISAIWVIPALLLFQNWWIFLVVIPVYIAKIYLAKYFTKWIGGYTGDCLGTTQQVTEIITLLFCLALWKFI